MTSIIIALLVIALLILIHELGHFMAARLMGVRVEEFSIGFAPTLFSKTIGQTKYSIGLLLFGGYVRMFGQNISDEDKTIPDNYAAKNPWQRLFIVLAGPAINIAFAILIMPLAFKAGIKAPAFLFNEPAIIEEVTAKSNAEILGFTANDQIVSVNNQKINNWNEFNQAASKNPSNITVSLVSASGTKEIRVPADKPINQSFGLVPLAQPIVGEVKADWPAAVAGLQKGDRILKLGDIEINSYNQISQAVNTLKNDAVTIEYSRMVMGEVKKFSSLISARFDADESAWRIGVNQLDINKTYSWGESIRLGWNNIVRLNEQLWLFFGKLFTADISKKDVGGPIMIVKFIDMAATQGISSLIIMMAFISFQLGVFNLLPIPVLDGGHVVLLIAELITKKTPSAKTRNRIQIVGTVLLLGVMILVTIQDLLRL